MYIEIHDDEESINYFNTDDMITLRCDKWTRTEEDGTTTKVYSVKSELNIRIDSVVYLSFHSRERQLQVYHMLKSYMVPK